MNRCGITPITVRILAVEFQFAADHAGVAAELLLPELIAEDGHRLRAFHRIRRHGGAADQRRHAHHVEGIHGAVIAAQALRIAVAGPDDVGPGGSDGS